MRYKRKRLNHKKMILELATFIIKQDKGKAFENNLQKASTYLSSAEGYQGHSLRKCVEQENKYILLVTWNTLENHTIGFRQSENFKEWRKILQEYFDAVPTVEHFELITEHTK
jgi:heme-degrading monooxygenase HmoA